MSSIQQNWRRRSGHGEGDRRGGGWDFKTTHHGKNLQHWRDDDRIGMRGSRVNFTKTQSMILCLCSAPTFIANPILVTQLPQSSGWEMVNQSTNSDSRSKIRMVETIALTGITVQRVSHQLSHSNTLSNGAIRGTTLVQLKMVRFRDLNWKIERK